ncbi:hypothetical protein ACOME3_009164 [Neoechinorhynchus agilis]
MNAGMNKEAVQQERGPRNSTIRRQIALMLKTSINRASDGVPDISNSNDVCSKNRYQVYGSDIYKTRNIPVLQPKISQGLRSSQCYLSDTNSLKEMAARLLLFAISWLKTLPFFTSLPVETQVA